ncbi:S8 family serine peptidase [candidate division KSB1 bacterium]|nr:S8 family serine peptidase [candidate division KSB1 bacterium]
MLFRALKIRFWFSVLLLAAVPAIAGQTILLRLAQKPNMLEKQTPASTGLTQVDQNLKKLGALDVRSISTESRPSVATQSTLHPIHRWVRIDLPNSVDLSAALQDLRRLDEIEIAYPNRVFRLHQWTPDDPDIHAQWALEKIGAFAAWQVERGMADIPVAVIDTGIDYSHPDLQENIWVNPGEDLNGNGRFDPQDLNGIDDDGNGFIDDIQGWDFTDAPNYPDGGDYLVRDNDPMDEFGHGTGVAGIVAAVADNGIGMAGLAHGCRVMNLRSFTARGLGEEDDTAAAILYAVDNGARVINMSWGDEFVTPLLEDALDYAASKDVVLVASSGNSANDRIHYPSAFASTISVGASTRSDTRAGFSNFGPTIDMLAPGTEIYTTALTTPYDSSFSGTSFAAPHVSAAAALLLSHSPRLSSDAVRGILQSSADDIGSRGWDPYSGAGRLNIARALDAPNAAVARIVNPDIDSGWIEGPIEIVGSAWSPNMEYYTLSYGSGDNPQEWTEIVSPQQRMVLDGPLGCWEALPTQEGSYMLRLMVHNRDGSQVQSSVRVFVDRTAPLVQNLEFLPMIDGFRHSVLIRVQTDDLCEAVLLYRPHGSDQPFQPRKLPYRSTDLSFNWSQEEVNGVFDVKLTLTNSVGLNTEVDQAGRPFRIDLDQPPIDVVRFTRNPWSIPFSYLARKAVDFDRNGFPELVANTYLDGGLDALRLYEFTGSNVELKSVIPTRLIPRDIRDSDLDGQKILAGYGFDSYVYGTTSPGTLPLMQMMHWPAGTEMNYMASRFIDADGDGHSEYLMRLIEPGIDANSDRFVVIAADEENPAQLLAELANPTEGENFNGVPHAEIADFDGDDMLDVLLGDSDGDLYIFEHQGQNRFTPNWQDRLPLSDATTFLASGDFDGDGQIQFVAGCHSLDSQFNSEHAYDARHWLFRIYRCSEDNRYETAAEWRFMGYESPKDFLSGVSAADLDGDGDAEIFVSVFPDLYVIDYDPIDDYQIIFHHSPVQSIGPLVTDLDQDGRAEFWVGDGDLTFSLSAVGSLSAPPAPVGLTAKPTGPGAVRLDWYVVPGASEYHVYRGETADRLIYYATALTEMWMDTTVEADKDYFYSVRTIDPERSPNTSGFSSVVVARPGEQPVLISAQAESSRQIRLVFSKTLNETARNTDHYRIEPDAGPFTSASQTASGFQVLLTLEQPLESSRRYTVRVVGLEDINGNPLNSSQSSATFHTVSVVQPPYLVGGERIEAEKIDLVFNTEMDIASLLNVGNYDMGEEIRIKQATTVDAMSDRVRLSLQPLVGFGALGKTWQIRVTGVKSRQGVEIEAGRGDHLNLIFVQPNLANVFTYPNPYRGGIDPEKIVFANLTREAEITVFTLDGRVVRTLVETDGDGGVAWDVRNEGGELLASGIYLYRVRYADETHMGKLAIVR